MKYSKPNSKLSYLTVALLIITIAGDNVIIFVKPNELVSISTQIYSRKKEFTYLISMCKCITICILSRAPLQLAIPILLITSSENFSDQFLTESSFVIPYKRI